MNRTTSRVWGCIIGLGTVLLASTPVFAQNVGFSPTLQELSDTARRGGDHAAQFRLGRRHYEGSGGATRDARVAVQWFEKSVANDGVAALMYLAACYQDGDGVPKSASTSIQYAKKYLEFSHKRASALAARGDTQAKQELDGHYHLEMGRIYYRRGTTGSPEYLARAVEEFQLSKSSGNTKSLVFLMACYLDGTGVQKNERTAQELWEECMQQRSPELISRVKRGDPPAKRELSAAYHSVLGSHYWDEGDSNWLEGRDKAFRYLSTAVAQGSESALCTLALCYKQGCGVPKDDQKYESLLKQWSTIRETRQTSERLSLEQQCQQFLASQGAVHMSQMRSANDRWRFIDKLIEFRVPNAVGGQELSAERRGAIEQDLIRYADASRKLKQMKGQIERVAILEGRLTENGKRQLFELSRTCDEIKARISNAVDGMEDVELIKRVAKETEIIPGEQRALSAARMHGIYSYEHVSALLWQARMFGHALNKTCHTTSMSQVLQKIQAHRYNSVTEPDQGGLAYDDDSELLLAAGIMMLEVQRIIDDRQHSVPTDVERATLKDLLVEYKYLLESATRRVEAEPGKSQQRMQETKAAFAYSWNACQKLIDAR